MSRTFLGKPIPNPVETVVVGRYAEILPWDFATLPPSDFDPQALPLFVSQAQAEALNLLPVAALSPPTGQGQPADRLHMIVGKMEDTTMTRPARGATIAAGGTAYALLWASRRPT